MITQRYATDENGAPVLEVAHWMEVEDDDPRGVALDGEPGKWMWVSASVPLAPVHEQISSAVVDPVTGVVLDPGGDILDGSLYWDLLNLPLRPGWIEIDRDTYADLIALRDELGDNAHTHGQGKGFGHVHGKGPVNHTHGTDEDDG